MCSVSDVQSTIVNIQKQKKKLLTLIITRKQTRKTFNAFRSNMTTASMTERCSGQVTWQSIS